jgi:ribulose-phosphate 3-epimerase
VFDAHLMISDPAKYLDSFVKAGCDLLTFHYEAVPDPAPLLRRIREADRAAGLALNPGTPVEAVEPFLNDCDVVLVMSVEPGFGGQKFLPSALDKLRWLRERAPSGTLLSIDGGIGPETIGPCAQAGAEIFAVGSAVFEANDYGEAIERLRKLATV